MAQDDEQNSADLPEVDAVFETEGDSEGAENVEPAEAAPHAAAETLAPEVERALVERARQREFEAFETLVAGHQDRIYRLAVRMTGSPSDAQEVVQEALLSAWRNLPRFEGKSQFGSWLYRIAANAALMLLRSRRRHPVVSVDEVPADIVDQLGRAAPPGFTGASAGDDWTKRPDDQLQSAELRGVIEAAVQQLPEGAREVFVMRDLEGLSTEETAELLGLSVPAVKTRLHRARLSLRQNISEYFARR